MLQAQPNAEPCGGGVGVGFSPSCSTGSAMTAHTQHPSPRRRHQKRPRAAHQSRQRPARDTPAAVTPGRAGQPQRRSRRAKHTHQRTRRAPQTRRPAAQPGPTRRLALATAHSRAGRPPTRQATSVPTSAIMSPAAVATSSAALRQRSRSSASSAAAGAIERAWFVLHIHRCWRRSRPRPGRPAGRRWRAQQAREATGGRERPTGGARAPQAVRRRRAGRPSSRTLARPHI